MTLIWAIAATLGCIVIGRMAMIFRREATRLGEQLVPVREFKLEDRRTVLIDSRKAIPQNIGDTRHALEERMARAAGEATQEVLTKVLDHIVLERMEDGQTFGYCYRASVMIVEPKEGTRRASAERAPKSLIRHAIIGSAVDPQRELNQLYNRLEEGGIR